MKKKLSVFFMSIFLLLILFSVPQYTLASEVAILKEVNGEVVLTKGGGKMEFIAFNGMQVQEGDSIRTGKNSSVKIDFGNDNQATLGEYGKVTLAKLSGTEGENEFTILSAYSGKEVTIKQESGGLWSKVKRVFGAGNSHKVETSTAIMGVRGTLFLTLIDRNNQESVSVIDGTVGVEKARGTSYTGTTEPKVTPNLALTLNGQEPLESQSINYQELFDKVDAILATEIVVDAVEAAEHQAAQAEKELQELDKSKDKEQAKKALELAAKAELMAAVAEQAVTGANQSSNSSQVNTRLQQRQQSLQQLGQRTERAKERSQQTRQQVELLAIQSGVTEAEIKQTTEATLKEVEKITVQNPTPTTTTSPSSGGGSSSESVSVTGVSISHPYVTLLQGETFQLSAVVSPMNATNKSVNWQSSNTNVATVSTTGLVTAKALGEATITVTTVDGNRVASISVLVTEDNFYYGYSASYNEDWYWDQVGETGVIALSFYNMILTNSEFDISRFVFGSDGKSLTSQYSKKEYSHDDYLYEKGSYVIHGHQLRVYLTDQDKEIIHSVFLNNQLSTVSTLEGWYKINGVNQPTISSIQFRDQRYWANYYKDLSLSSEAVNYIGLGLSFRNRENIDFTKMQLVSSNGQVVELSSYDKVIGSSIYDEQLKGTIYIQNNYYGIEIVLKDEHLDMFKNGVVKVKAAPGWNPNNPTSGFEIPIYYYDEYFNLQYSFINNSTIEIMWDKSKLSREYNFYRIYYYYYDYLLQESYYNSIDIDNTICINNICKVVIEDLLVHAEYNFTVNGYSQDWNLHGQYSYGHAYGRVNVTRSEVVISQQFSDSVLASNIATWLGKTVNDTITKEEINNKLHVTGESLYLESLGILSMEGFEIFNGTNLRELSLTSNQLVDLDVSGLTNLTRLNLHHNSFETFPIGILGLEELAYLNIEGNPIDLSTGQNAVIHSELIDRLGSNYLYSNYEGPTIQNIDVQLSVNNDNQAVLYWTYYDELQYEFFINNNLIPLEYEDFYYDSYIQFGINQVTLYVDFDLITQIKIRGKNENGDIVVYESIMLNNLLNQANQEVDSSILSLNSGDPLLNTSEELTFEFTNSLNIAYFILKIDGSDGRRIGNSIEEVIFYNQEGTPISALTDLGIFMEDTIYNAFFTSGANLTDVRKITIRQKHEVHVNYDFIGVFAPPIAFFID